MQEPRRVVVLSNLRAGENQSGVAFWERTNGKRWERLLATLGQVLLARFWNGRRKQFQKSIQIVKEDRMPADLACRYFWKTSPHAAFGRLIVTVSYQTHNAIESKS